MSSYNTLKAYLKDRDTVLTMWSEYADTKTIQEKTGLCGETIRGIIRKAKVDGQIEERRIYHGKD